MGEEEGEEEEAKAKPTKCKRERERERNQRESQGEGGRDENRTNRHSQRTAETNKTIESKRNQWWCRGFRSLWHGRSCRWRSPRREETPDKKEQGERHCLEGSVRHQE